MKYVNLSVLVVFFLLSAFAGFDSYQILQRPVAYEPFRMYLEPGWLYSVFLPVTAMSYPFIYAPLWYQLLFFPTAAWVVLVYVLPHLLVRR